ncbi:MULTISPECIES: GvpL/GvpF family gas vesicle protein [Actinomadura]|uniref:GvpL/GvpF family gas vesicle protein n=1 Tax=Actinomadura yumaensis TaxID=111807 RepID=A0ABW2D3B9_9ACTN|nr:GvpL/GvpF family gas vesicle protein [Actinomadura sp. J1-007]MWK39793.1 gas vesicle synthesis GvpLGvpF [Actinomadura sp. J1-007]
MTNPQTPQSQAPAAGGAQYVYGVTRADASLPENLTGLEDGPVGLIAHERCAALTSDLPQGRALGERADLVAHQRVLDALVESGVVVLPFRFGAALSSRDAVRDELLASNSDRLGQVLDQLDGRVELRLKGTYVQEVVLREVMNDEPQIAELNQRLRDIPPEAADAAYYDRVRLGELIAQALEQRREDDGQVLLEALAPAAEAIVRRSPMREEDVLDASFLVERDRVTEFEQSVDKLGKIHGERIRIRLIGPLAPYDFVPEA